MIARLKAREPAILTGLAVVVVLLGIDLADLSARVSELVELLAQIGTVAAAIAALRAKVTPTSAPQNSDGTPLVPAEPQG